VSLAVSISICV